MGKDDPFVVPRHLLKRPVPQHNHNPLQSIADRYGIREFGEVTPSLLRRLYEQQHHENRQFFWRIINQLAFFGVIFESPMLSARNILSNWDGSLYLWPPQPIRSQTLRWDGAWSLRGRALEHGLVLKDDAFGVPLKALKSLAPESPVEGMLREEGFEVLTFDELNEREYIKRGSAQPERVKENRKIFESTEDERAVSEEERDLRFKVAGQEFALSTIARHDEISVLDFPRCPALIEKLRERGYRTWGSLPYELDDFLLDIKGVGKAHLKKFSVSLAFIEASTPETSNSSGGVFATASPRERSFWREVDISSLQEVPITDDIFPECQQLVEQLRHRGFDTLAGLSQISDIAAFLRGFGEEVHKVEAERFLQILAELMEILRRTGAAKFFFLRGEYVAISKRLSEMPLGILAECGSSAMSPLAERLAGNGFQVIGDLPASPRQATKGDAEAVTECLSTLFGLILLHKNRAEEWLGSYLLDQLAEYAAILAYGGKPPENLLHSDAPLKSLSSLVGIAAGGRPDGVKGRGWELFHMKLDHLQRGDRLTLEKMGRILGVTRERARQIQRETLQVLVEPYRPVIADLRILLQEAGNQFTPLNFLVLQPITDMRAKLALALLLETQDIYLDPQNGLLSTFNASERRRMFSHLKRHVDDHFDGQVFSAEALTEAVKEFVEANMLSEGAQPALFSYIKDTFLTVLPDNRLGLRLTKDRLALQVFKEYAHEHPDGVALYRDAGLLRARLDQIQPNIFTKDHNFIQSLLRREEVVLWGRGRYIHQEQLSVSPSDLRPVVDWIRQRLQQGIPHLSSRAAFLEFEAELKALGLPNDYAMYSCLRLFFAEHFFLPEYPKIFAPGQQRNLSNSEILEEHLRRHGDQTYAALQGEFVDKRGWHLFQLANTIKDTESVIRTGKGVYGLLRAQSARKKDLIPLADHLESRFGLSPSISVRLLLRERRATCLQLGIANEHLLYSLMDRYFGDRFLFPQFPHITRRSYDFGSEISNKRFVEAFLSEAGGPVLKEELQHEFIQKRGWAERELNNALLYQENILPLYRGAVAEFVHGAVMEWDEDKQECFEEWVQEVAEIVNKRNFPFGNVRRDLLDKSRLPALGGGIKWTEDLLKAKLEEMETLLLLGTKHSVFAAYPNAAGVEDDDDFVAYVLRTEFGGAAKTQALQRRLVELEFRTQQLKRPSDEKAAELPYYFVGDEILLKEG